MPVYRKEKPAILEEIKTKLEKKGFDTSDSSVNVLFADAIAEQMAEQYDDLFESFNEIRLSTSSLQSLDDIGYDRGVDRLIGETDDNYRYRITLSESELATANEEAIYAHLLKNPEIKDVRFIPFTHGTGSGTILVITHDPFFDEDKLKEIERSLKSAVAWGNRYNCMIPTPITVRMELRVLFNQKLRSNEIASYKEFLAQKLREYIASLMPGDSLVVTKIYSIVHESKLDTTLSSSEKAVTDVKIIKMFSDSKQVEIENIECGPLERIVPDTSEHGILIL